LLFCARVMIKKRGNTNAKNIFFIMVSSHYLAPSVIAKDQNRYRK
jgi:hypothetical protein